MSYQILEPQKFTKEASGRDALALAALWLEEMQTTGWEPVAVEVRGTTGHCTVTGPERSLLVFRHHASPPRSKARK